MNVGAIARAAGFRAIWCDQLPSTSDEAMSRARSGEPAGLWVLAGEQTQGRGRQGRPWSSPRGNFHGSVLLLEPCAPRFAPQLGFVAGVSLLQALRAATPAARLAIKWPNDVLCDGAKLAGVLVEGATLPGNVFACVIGFGVNCAAAPDNLPYPAASLAQMGHPCEPGELLRDLSDRLASNLALWRAGEGFAAIRNEWLKGAYRLGEHIEARTHAGAMRGIFQTIDDQGRLVLAGPTGVATVEAADVFPIAHASAAAAYNRT